MPITTNCKIMIHYVKYEGHIKQHEMNQVVEDIYDDNPARYIIHDFRKIDATKIRTEQIKKVSKEIQLKILMDNIGGGKTAFVVSDALSYGLTRMVEAHGFENAKFEIDVFYKMEEALNWIIGIETR